MTHLRAALVRLIELWLRVPPVLRASAPAVIMLALWYSSSLPPDHSPPSVLRMWLHNGAHVVAYACLATAWLLLFLPRPWSRPSSSPSSRSAAVPSRSIAATIVLTVLYGAVDELHQLFVPGRACSVWDLMSDTCGGVLAVCGVLWALSGERRFAFRIGIVFLACLAAVSAATWLPG